MQFGHISRFCPLCRLWHFVQPDLAIEFHDESLEHSLELPESTAFKRAYQLAVDNSADAISPRALYYYSACHSALLLFDRKLAVSPPLIGGMGSHQSRPSPPPHTGNRTNHSGGVVSPRSSANMPLEASQESVEDGISTSGVGSKRRARASVASSAVGSSTSPTAVQQSTSNDSSAVASGSSAGRPRRASRVLSQIKDGFRRSESTRSIAGVGTGRRSGRDLAMPVQNMDSEIQDMDVQGLPRSSSYTAEKQSRVERRDKRRKIGDYEGPSRVASSEDVTSDLDTTHTTSAIDAPVILAAPLETLAKESQHPIQQDPVAVDTPEATAAPPFSPPIVPLTDSDPFLNDRLRSLEAIRSVLGDDVVRRLPSVQSLRELNQAHASAEPASEPSEAEAVDRHSEVGSARRVSIPPSTLDLLNELESTTAPSTATALDTPREGDSAPIESTQRPLYQTEASTVSSNGRSSIQQSERNARRASIRNFTNRLGGWLGIGTPRNETSNDTEGGAAGTGTHGDMAVDPQSTPASSSTTLPADGTAATQTETNASGATAATSTTGNRLATGAVMIVQGFVQTTAPVRQRHTVPSSNATAGPSRTTAAPSLQRSATRDANTAGINESSSSGFATDTVPVHALSSVSEVAQEPSRSETARWGELVEEEFSAEGAHTRNNSGQNDTVLPHLSATPVSEESSAAGESGFNTSSGSSAPSDAPESSSAAAGQTGAGGEQPSFVQQARMLGGLLR